MKNKVQRLKMETKHRVKEHIEIIGKLFPNTLTEVIEGYNAVGDPIMKSAIDFDVLRQELSEVLVEGTAERYQMNWPDKRKSILLANTPTNMTLRPCREESVDFDSTENLYIEGNNLEVLKLLQETYLNKVKMIYIDPPYNTGNDSFVYDDNFKMDEQVFSEMSGKYDVEGNVIFDIKENNEANGRFHTDWLNMMYPRLKIARDLLREDGVIFISIDDKENHNMRKICDEIFGEKNFIASIVWEKVHTRKNSAKYFSASHDYILCYAKIKNDDKNSNGWTRNLLRRADVSAYTNPDNDPKGPWKSDPIYANNPYEANYEIVKPNGVKLKRPQGKYWRYSEETIKKAIAEERILWGGENSYPTLKRYLSEVQDGLVPVTLFKRDFAGDNGKGNDEIKKLFQKDKLFSYPKPTTLLKKLIEIGCDSNDIIMDFFSGSATTAHAVMGMNAEDNGKRKFIMVQLPEETAEKSEAYKEGYRNICELGKERIRRVGEEIKKENLGNIEYLDTGFRVLKLDSSNMRDVYYKPNEYSQEMLGEIQENIKEDRTSEDLLFQVMLDLGEVLSSSIEECRIAGKEVFIVGQGNIIACFDTGVTEEVVIEIAKRKPYYAIFRDSSIVTDSVAANFEQIFETHSSTTIRKVL